MEFPIVGGMITVSFLLVAASSGLAQDYETRLATDRSALRTALVDACPKRRAEIQKLARKLSKRERRQVLVALEVCGRKLEMYHLTTGAAHFAVNDFNGAEGSHRRALALRVTESAQVSLLNALVRQKSRTTKQNADLAKHLDYFRQRTCTRDDLCVGLAYVAWHLQEYALTKRASEQAIKLGFPGWQPYFFGGTTYAGGEGASERRSRTFQGPILIRSADGARAPTCGRDAAFARASSANLC